MADLALLTADIQVKGYRTSLEADCTFRWIDAPSSELIQVEHQSTGWRIQLGYFVSDKIELAGRWALVNGLRHEGKPTDAREVLGGINYYFFKHGLKIQGDWGLVKHPQYPTAQYRTRFQLQFAY
jgi:hypothetical protein